MPRKSKKTPSFPEVRRGRPRKIIDSEAFAPFETHEVSTLKDLESREKNLKPASDKRKALRMNPATSDRGYTTDEVEFMNALAEFKRKTGRTFPTCSEILSVLRGLGYEKTLP